VLGFDCTLCLGRLFFHLQAALFRLPLLPTLFTLPPTLRLGLGLLPREQRCFCESKESDNKERKGGERGPLEELLKDTVSIPSSRSHPHPDPRG
jgi:hypothetical protein